MSDSRRPYELVDWWSGGTRTAKNSTQTKYTEVHVPLTDTVKAVRRNVRASLVRRPVHDSHS